MDRNYLTNKVFLVTGAGSGIGFETVRVLMQNGARVVAMVRRMDSMKEFKKMYPDTFITFIGDVSKQKSCEDFVKSALKRFKTIHGLIHCAGVGIRSYARDISHDVFRDVMDINFYSMVYLYTAARTALEKTNGHVVAVSSVHGLIALPYRSAYSAAKHALHAYINSIRHEEKKVFFLCVNFGYVNTGFSRNAVTGNGNKFGKDSPSQKKGMKVEKAVLTMLDAMISRKKEITPAGWKERLTLYIHRFFPILFDKLIMRFVKPD